ncbi:hypothetical protein [Caldimonas tepidiphila]|uniref:hypothetical protein n=1 Tax=Caldimonas tepidiphila TaxID=2315841 RepID=UPI000E5BC635|nr:hypothetical protein [Caldimonas tepidiphila]
MQLPASVVFAWLLLLLALALAALCFRRAWTILVRRNFAEVAVRQGQAPADPARWAPYAAVIHLVAGAVVLASVLAALLGLAPFSTWSSTVGLTLWIYLFALHLLARRAHVQGKRDLQSRPGK